MTATSAAEPPVAAALATRKEKSDYFCSELVACALQDCGLIEPSRNPTFFWPGAFAARGEIDRALLHGAAYGEEVLINCSTPAVAAAVRRAPRR